MISAPKEEKVQTKELVSLHAEVAAVLSRQLKADELDPKFLELAIKFLDNNGITAPPLEATDDVKAKNMATTLGRMAALADSFKTQDQIGYSDVG